MTQQTIEVEGLPEGWKAVAYRRPLNTKEFIYTNGQVMHPFVENLATQWLIVEKIQPRRKLSAQEIAEDYDPSAPNGYD